jgi:ppGpp synthetase/RelA/SpoT-type nucleotidyltranferase
MPKRRNPNSLFGYRPMAFSIVTAYAFFVTSSVSGFSAERVCVRRRFLFQDVRLQFSAGASTEEEVIADVNALALSSPSKTLIAPRDKEDSLLPPWLQRMEESTPDQVKKKIRWLEFSLLEHGFSVKDMSDITKAIYLCASGDVPKILGAIEFCQLTLRMDQDGGDSRRYKLFATKDVLMASILHYTECVDARLDGVYQRVQKALRIEGEGSTTTGTADAVGERTISLESPLSYSSEGNMNEEGVFPTNSISLRSKLSVADRLLRSEGFEFFSTEALRLAEGASRIKRAEILVHAVLTNDRTLTKAEYSDVRDLLLSVMEDWRALAIRCVASLYRLERVLASLPPGIPGTGEYLRRTADVTLAARESIRVYANLSQRLGLHRLKTQLEGKAFRILYPRQFSAVSTLFRQKGESMKAVSSFLSSQVKKMLHEDESLMAQLEDVELTSRVKEPYSFWKKLLKKRQEDQSGLHEFLTASNEISVIDVQDGVALRVIIKARKLTPSESDEATRSRERMLCYYVHHLIRSRWPAVDLSRIKDYIQKPKSNGYQSLHHTSVITRNGEQIPFEVQVRSEEMHRIAEFGVAAHWDYKLGRAPIASLPPASLADDVVISGMPCTEGSVLAEGRAGGNEAGESAYIEALKDARQYLVRSNVFVFLAGSSSALEEGQLLSLPAGAQIVDILAELPRKMDLPYDASELRIWRNGKIALLDEVVGNGDVLLLQDLTLTREKAQESTYIVS